MSSREGVNRHCFNFDEDTLRKIIEGWAIPEDPDVYGSFRLRGAATFEPPDEFEIDAMAAESLLGSPRPDLPSPMQRLMTPFKRLVLRLIRVYWVQQLAIDRALLTAMRTLRREARHETASETARMREELTALAADTRALRERVDAMTSSDDDRPAPRNG